MHRFAKVLVAGVAFLGAPAGLMGPATAAADPAVVTATIFSGGAAGVSTQTVTLGALANCPTADSSPFILNPGGLAYQPAAGSSWSLGTIVSCGL
ncbi:MAG: hypothetical protein M3022_03435, partial [Actinomycetota bacterium]|nr:hypothetical protein [Actinomycetota bacterium]